MPASEASPSSTRRRDSASARASIAPASTSAGDASSSKTRARKESTRNLDSESEGSDDDDEDEQEDKKARLRKKVKTEQANGGNEDVAPLTAWRPEAPQRDDDGYAVGSIVRVTCHNFVTYDNVEFRPGPYLNMIIGPNGSGKSTVACAIALGLGFKPEILARASNIRRFVKDTADKGWVEIELKGPIGDDNLVIRRDFDASSDKSDFKINGNKTTLKSVHAAVAELQVQVDNLCSFLPQDRVTHFSKLTPQDLLQETQKAAGAEQLTEWQEALVEKSAEERKIAATVKTAQDELKRLVEKNKRLESDVSAFQKRREIQSQIDVLELGLVLVNYNESRAQYSTAKSNRNVVQNELKELKARNVPFENSKAALNAIVKALDSKRKSGDLAVKKAMQSLDLVNKEINGVQKNADKTSQDLVNAVDQEEARQEAIAKLQKTVNKLAAQTKDKVDKPDMSELSAEQRELGREQSKLTEQIGILDAEREGHKQAQSTATREINTAREKLKRATDFHSQRFDQLKQSDRQTAIALEWIRANANLFQGRIHDPPRLSATVTDRSHVRLAEAAVGAYHIWKTIVFEVEEDRAKFMEAVDAGRVKDGPRPVRVNTTTMSSDTSMYSRKYSDEQLRGLGFDCLAIDLIDAPAPVMAYLCDSSRLHETPVAIQSNQIKHDAIKGMPKGQMPKRFIEPDGMHLVKISPYGRGNIMTETRELKDAQFLQASTNPEFVRNLERAIQEAEEKHTEAGQLEQEVGSKIQQAKSESRDIRKTLDEIKKQKEDMSVAYSKYSKAQSNHRATLSTLERHLKEPGVEATIAKLNGKLTEYNTKRLDLLEKKQLRLEKVCKMRANAIATSLRSLQTHADLRAMDESSNDRDQELLQKQAQCTKADQEVARARDRANRYAEEWQELQDSMGDELVEEASALIKQSAERTASDIEDEIAVHKDTLRTTASIDPKIIDQYNDRKAQIESRQEGLESDEEQLEDLRSAVEQIKARYRPALQYLITNVSKAYSKLFSDIGRQGEVTLAESDDPEKWGIQIMVAFRNGEELQKLDNHRQSGGERSLATIAYLLALGQQIRAPFSLVDEIDQGLDAQTQRDVHNAIVEAKCKTESQQMFLITPKLQTHLSYDPRMKIHVVNNGPWLPEKLNLRSIVERRLQKRQRRGNAQPLAPRGNMASSSPSVAIEVA